MSDRVTIPFTHVRIGRFLFLLVFLLLVFFVRPLLVAMPGFGLMMDGLFTAVLISGVFASGKRTRWFRWMMLLAVLTLAALWAGKWIGLPALRTLGSVGGALFMALLSVLLVVHLFTQREVTFDLITGSVCGYLLVGQFWAFLYFLLEHCSPGSLSLSAAGGNDLFSYSYFSFVTLTTLGYGDISPATPTAQSLATLEAVVGQLYVAVIVARLVGIQASQSLTEK